MAPADPDVADALRALREDVGPEVVHDLVGLYLRSAPEQMRALRAATDPGTARRAAHALRGSSATLGAKGLATLCAEVEASFDAVDPEAVAALDAELSRVLETLGAMVPTMERGAG